jgi:hypothetical protein
MVYLKSNRLKEVDGAADKVRGASLVWLTKRGPIAINESQFQFVVYLGCDACVAGEIILGKGSGDIISFT